MKNISDTIKLFLDKQVARNGRLFLSLVFMLILFIVAHYLSIFEEIIKSYGFVAVGIILLVCWLIIFIAINLYADMRDNSKKLKRDKLALQRQKIEQERELQDCQQRKYEKIALNIVSMTISFLASCTPYKIPPSWALWLLPFRISATFSA